MLTAIEKQEIIKEHQTKAGDTASTEVQVALLTADIKKLTEHFKANKHDFHSRMGLTRKVNQRRSLLKYLRSNDLDRYRAILKKLGLRELSTQDK
jgi:small subunit ribosomal protein S15